MPRACARTAEPLTKIKQVFEGGTTRSAQDGRYDLIPSASLAAMARRFAYGAGKHGEHKWRRGGEAYRRAVASHLMEHLADYLENGNAADANTDAIICNAAMLCHFEQERPFKGAPKRKRSR